MSDAYRQYALSLEQGLQLLYGISDAARAKGLDPSLKTECKVAKDLADLVEGLVGPPGVASSIRQLSAQLQREELAFKVAEEIVYGKFGHMEPEESANQAIRTALAIFTEGLTAAPLQGITKVAIRTNNDRSRYLAIYFAGPMRSAGGTDQALTLVVGDFVRRLLGLDRYKPTPEEISRFVEEVRLYERSVTRFQYHISDEELQRALQWIPVEVTGTESNPVEVSSYRNLPRIETNRLRGGALRVVNDGIVGRAPKVITIIEKLGFQGWDWLRDIRRKSETKSAGFMDDVIGGRPIFSFPSKPGGFRLRYGRARNTGLSAVGIHPVTMLVLQGFLAGGTQLRLELPGKGGVVVPVDTIEPPVVKLKDGSVVKVTEENFQRLKRSIDKILFLGDILVSYGDFLYNNKALAPSPYVEEWWAEDLQKTIMDKFKENLDEAAAAAKIPSARLREILQRPLEIRPTVDEALALSRLLGVPLHPRFSFFWSNLDCVEDVKSLRAWLLSSDLKTTEGTAIEVVGALEVRVKEIMERICLPFFVSDGRLRVVGEDALALCACLGLGGHDELTSPFSGTCLDAIHVLSGLSVKDKGATFVGARMGRPEKAKRREMKPLVQVLFPVGLSGGSHRDLMEAAQRGPTFIELVKRKCPNCKTFTSRVQCPECGHETILENSCPRCGKPLKGNECPDCKTIAKHYSRQAVNFKEMVENACNRVGASRPKILKGVKGLVNDTKTPEPVEKGVLRALHDLSVYKDGTVRFDATNAPLTHFKPLEVGVSVERLIRCGYTHAADGAPLNNADQICELKLQDIIIPMTCAQYFVHAAAFLDDLLERVYGLPRHYNIGRSEDLIGHLVVGLAPHTCAGILGRIVGFTNLNLCYAHPIWHSAKRRDCDGDEDALMLALDTLINFSRSYLPVQIGGIMDAPLLMIPVVNTEEVQRQAHDFDVAGRYPIEFYEATLEHAEARQATHLVDLVGHRLGTEKQFEGFAFTMPVSNVNSGNEESAYKQFKSMVEKVDAQLDLAERIEAVDARRVALKVLTTHFIRDIAGNLRAFSTQAFRCKSCSKRYRRLPLRGKCFVCGGQLTLTVYRGGMEKYLEVAQHLVKKYRLPQYYAQRIGLMEEEIAAMFNGKKTKQISLADFA